MLWDRIRNLRATGAVQRRVGGGLLRVNGLLGWFGNENSQDLLIRSGAGVDSFRKAGPSCAIGSSTNTMW